MFFNRVPSQLTSGPRERGTSRPRSGANCPPSLDDLEPPRSRQAAFLPFGTFLAIFPPPQRHSNLPCESDVYPAHTHHASMCGASPGTTPEKRLARFFPVAPHPREPGMLCLLCDGRRHCSLLCHLRFGRLSPWATPLHFTDQLTPSATFLHWQPSSIGRTDPSDGHLPPLDRTPPYAIGLTTTACPSLQSRAFLASRRALFAAYPMPGGRAVVPVRLVHGFSLVFSFWCEALTVHTVVGCPRQVRVCAKRFSPPALKRAPVLFKDLTHILIILPVPADVAGTITGAPDCSM